MSSKIYYLPGYGGELQTGLGEELQKRGVIISGRATVGEFAKLSFADQIELVVDDLTKNFWSQDSRVIANSFGAYLFHHAQSQLPSYVGKVLLLSPVVGDFSQDDGLRIFSPPRSGKLQSLVKSGEFNSPFNCQIHVGSKDWQSNPENVTELAKLLDIPVHVVENSGHMLSKEYVQELLDRWMLR
jgi:pimeloyl-ACP methyl ester carboxylesterase